MLPQQKESNPVWLDRAIKMLDSDGRKDGDILSHDWIKYALDVPVAKSVDDADRVQWLLLGRVEAFKDWLLVERKIALQNVRGEGYRLIPPREQAHYAATEAMKMVKKGIVKGDKLMTHVRLSELDAEERKRHTDAHIRLAGVGDMIKRQRKDIFKLFFPHKEPNK